MGKPGDTIVAVATPSGVGALGIVRLSGPEAIAIADTLFKEKNLSKEPGYTLHYGPLVSENETIDEVLLSLFRAPSSFTREDAVEFSCHGSSFILQRVVEACLSLGAKPAGPGEFTQRAYLNGAMDLVQAEAVAELIAAENAASHRAALSQLRGGFSKEIALLRERLIDFAGLVELELDFSQEDVEFADRSQLEALVMELQGRLRELVDSFRLGNVVKNGVPVVIVGKPNAGKSTLLNALLQEDKAIVSDIPGTTRDSIEDVMQIGGLSFRFIDTAGLRETEDPIEAIGVARTRQKMEQASIILHMVDSQQADLGSFQAEKEAIDSLGIATLHLANKADEQDPKLPGSLAISAKTGKGLEELKAAILATLDADSLQSDQTLVLNARHHGALKNALNAVEAVGDALSQGIPGDLLAIDIRAALQHLGEITGEISPDELLGAIFGKFCIGK